MTNIHFSRKLLTSQRRLFKIDITVCWSWNWSLSECYFIEIYSKKRNYSFHDTRIVTMWRIPKRKRNYYNYLWKKHVHIDVEFQAPDIRFFFQWKLRWLIKVKSLFCLSHSNIHATNIQFSSTYPHILGVVFWLIIEISKFESIFPILNSWKWNLFLVPKYWIPIIWIWFSVDSTDSSRKMTEKIVNEHQVFRVAATLLFPVFVHIAIHDSQFGMTNMASKA